jgi:hypothetical protein
MLQAGSAGSEHVLASGTLPMGDRFTVHLEKKRDLLALRVNRRALWNGRLPDGPGLERTGVLGWRVETNTHLRVEQCRLRGEPRPARVTFGHLEALLGVAEAPANWEARQGPS